MSERIQSIFVSTCFLIASKYDEIDDRLVFIDDIKSYLKTTKYKNEIPTYTDIVETERMLLKFFEWDLGFVLPLHFLEMFLAQGIFFANEVPLGQEAAQMSSSLNTRAYRLLDECFQRRDSFKNHGCLPSEMAALMVYQARKDKLNGEQEVWPV